MSTSGPNAPPSRPPAGTRPDTTTKAELDIDDVCSGHPMAKKELSRLRILVSQRGAQLQTLRAYMRETDWQHFCQDNPEADGWFDADGVPVLR